MIGFYHVRRDLSQLTVELRQLSISGVLPAPGGYFQSQLGSTERPRMRDLLVKRVPANLGNCGSVTPLLATSIIGRNAVAVALRANNKNKEDLRLLRRADLLREIFPISPHVASTLSRRGIRCSHDAMVTVRVQTGYMYSRY